MGVKIKAIVGSFKRNWKTPPNGRYMTYKEIAAFATGGIGVKFIVYVVAKMILAVGNTLLGNTIGITPSGIYIIYIISVVCSFPLTAIRAKMIDSVRSMKGKYRPYILSMGIPTAVLGGLFMFMPYENMTEFQKCVTVLLFNIGFQFFYMFFLDSYDSLINVLSPNSIERSDVVSVKCIVENLSPSVANILLPLIASMITGNNNLYDIKIYRIIFPPMVIVGFALSMLIYTNTEEKIVQSRTHVVQLKFIDAFREIAKNKYFWIISMAGWLGFLESSFTNILGWMYSYQNACSPGQYSLITALAGNASFWPNLIAPFFIRKYGKKKILIVTNLLNIVLIVSMIPVVKMTGNPNIIWVLLLCTFANNFITSLGSLLNPSIQADIRDYQQYVSGERIDGMFAAVGLIGSVITLATSSVLPAICERAGLNETVAVRLGYSAENVYDVLYNTEYFVQICTVLIMVSVVGAIMNVVPFFFYDLTETDQRGMIAVLKIRAVFDDYHEGTLEYKKLEEVIGILNDTRKNCEKELIPIEKRMSNEDKKSATDHNECVLIARRVQQELNRNDSEAGRYELETAQKFAAAGIDGFTEVQLISLEQARALPKKTGFEAEVRKNTVSLIKAVGTAKKAKNKYFPNGAVYFDTSVFEKLFAASDENERMIAEKLANLKAEKSDNGDRTAAKSLKKDIASLQYTRKEIEREIKKATFQNSVYHRAAKPYLDAVALINRSKDYADLDVIYKLYEKMQKEHIGVE